jgi:hypothetical protein
VLSAMQATLLEAQKVAADNARKFLMVVQPRSHILIVEVVEGASVSVVSGGRLLRNGRRRRGDNGATRVTDGSLNSSRGVCAKSETVSYRTQSR